MTLRISKKALARMSHVRPTQRSHQVRCAGMRLAAVWLAVAAILHSTSQQGCAQVWFSTDYLYWNNHPSSDWLYVVTHTKDSEDNPLTLGLIHSSDAAPGFQSGYRFNLGTGLGAFEVEGSFLDFNGWSATEFRQLPAPLSLDGEFTSEVVFPADSHSLAFPSGIGFAAGSAGESFEAELLAEQADVIVSYASDLRDLQLNCGSNRDRHWLRWGIGYRHLKVSSSGRLSLSGTFDARNTVVPPDPDPPASSADTPPDNPADNNGLSHDALIAAGFTNVISPDGFDAIDATTSKSDTVAMLFDGRAVNQLDGLQVTGGVRTAWSDILWFDGLLRLGAFHNQIAGATSERLIGSGEDDSVYRRALDDRKSSVAFAVNPALQAVLSLTDHVTINAGYEVLYLWGVGVGPDQIGRMGVSAAASSTYVLDRNGEFVAHGGSIGLEIRW